MPESASVAGWGLGAKAFKAQVPATSAQPLASTCVCPLNDWYACPSLLSRRCRSQHVIITRSRQLCVGHTIRDSVVNALSQ